MSQFSKFMQNDVNDVVNENEKLFKNIYLQIPSSEYSVVGDVYGLSFICRGKSNRSRPKNHSKIEHNRGYF